MTHLLFSHDVAYCVINLKKNCFISILKKFVAASNLLSWSYQSTNPCTVLVKEKHDNVQENSPLSASTNRPRSSVEHSQQTSVTSIEPNDSGGTNGGKHRARRSLNNVDVVGIEDVVSHTQSTEHGDTNKHEFKRILVNISIATDTGLGTHNLQVYQLQVAVPLPTINATSDDVNNNKDNNFYAYAMEDNAMELIQRPTEWQAGNLMFQSSDEETTTTDPTTEPTTTTEWLVSSENNEMDSEIMTSTTDESVPTHYTEGEPGH